MGPYPVYSDDIIVGTVMYNVKFSMKIYLLLHSTSTSASPQSHVITAISSSYRDMTNEAIHQRTVLDDN